MSKQIKKIVIDTDLKGAIASLGIDYIIKGLRPGDLVVVGASTTWRQTYRLSRNGALNPYTKHVRDEPTSFLSPVCICKEAEEGEHECPAIDADACTIQYNYY